MAIQKALFTNQSDFIQIGSNQVGVDPFLYYNGDQYQQNKVTIQMQRFGSPAAIGPGIRGNAAAMDGGCTIWRNVPNPAARKRMISLWIKPTAADLSRFFSVICTDRGDGWTDHGMHLALNFDSAKQKTLLNARIIRSGSGTSQWYTHDPDQGTIEFQADQWYHICFFYDADGGLPGGRYVAVYVNKTLQLQSFVAPFDITAAYTRSFTLGDMPNNGSYSGTYRFSGMIDEVIRLHGDDVWTIQQMGQYYDDIMAGNYIDAESEPGTMKVGKNFVTGQYNTNLMTWTSPTIDLGQDGFDDFGRVQLNFEQPPGTFINIYTRTSDDGQKWDSWVKTSADGTINSSDKRYLQIKIEFQTTNGAITPKIMEVQVLDYQKTKRLTLTSEPLIIYKDLESGLERIGELKNAYDIIITEEINGEEVIEFKMASNDPKRIELGTEPVELIARIGDKQFIIRNAIDKRDESGKKYTQFFGEALWYELRDAKVINYEQVEKTAYEHIRAILNSAVVPTGWTIYKVESDGRKRTIRGEWKSVLELLREVADQFGGEIQFDTVNRTISLVNRIGEDNGVRFYYNKNLKTIERSVDTYNLVTRLYVYGKNGMDIKSVHPQGLDYIEDLTWVNALNLRNKIRIDVWKDERYTIPQNLYDDGMKMLTEMAKPNVSYAMTIADLSMLSGHEHESIGLGDTVWVVDTELMNLLVEARIVRRKYNVRQPWKTEVELNQPKKELADANQRAIDDAIEALVESDPLDTSDVQQMTVFNHLLNSRAEDGMKYWEVTGSDITIEPSGFSGNASWKIQSGYGKTNKLKQSIYGVSHRSAYTISAYVATEGTITRGISQDAFVGIKVTIHYTEPDSDGKTYEEHFLAIPDITQQGQEGEGGEE
ncbi:putative tail fiber protein [Geobacillus phage vB_GthS_PK2.1]|nr:putative tail fiber protein [Geobacillus phage vB_GthS_PK2.1]